MHEDIALMVCKRLRQQPYPLEQVRALLAQLVQRCAGDGQITRLKRPMQDAINVDEQDFGKRAGVAFDPQGFDVSGKGLYIQMVKPGVVHVGKWKSEDSMFTSGNLTVVHPPAENIIASKLVRCTDADIEDTVYLMRRLGVSLGAVKAAVATLSPAAQGMAAENMVMVEIHADLAGQAYDFDSGKRLSMAPAADTDEPLAPRRRMRR